MKKIISIALAVILGISIISVVAFAADSTPVTTEDGLRAAAAIVMFIASLSLAVITFKKCTVHNS